MQKLSFHHLPEYRMCEFRYFEPGEYHVTRIWPENVFIFMLEGTLKFIEQGKPVSVCKNHYYIQRAYMRQRADEPSDCPKYFYIHFIGSIDDGEGIPLEGEFDPLVMLPLFQEMNKVCHDPLRTDFEKRFVFYKLLAALDSSQRQFKTPRQELAEKLHEMIVEEYDSHFSIDDASTRLRYSKNYIIDVFREQYGTTPYKYVNLMRLDKARRLLVTTDKSCQEISDECGFSEYSLFYKLFRANFGISPQTYKQQMCQHDMEEIKDTEKK